MSAESKKKRGISGQAKAKSSPFRLNGRPPDWWARSAGAFQVGPSASSGSRTMAGILGGILAEKLGYPMHGSYERLLRHAQSRCSHTLFADDAAREAAE